MPLSEELRARIAAEFPKYPEKRAVLLTALHWVQAECAGWIPPGFVYDSSRVFSSHASNTLNPTLCAGCHVQRFVVGDPNTPDFTSVGHTCLPIPCVDASGKRIDERHGFDVVQGRSARHRQVQQRIGTHRL